MNIFYILYCDKMMYNVNIFFIQSLRIALGKEGCIYFSLSCTILLLYIYICDYAYFSLGLFLFRRSDECTS